MNLTQIPGVGCTNNHVRRIPSVNPCLCLTIAKKGGRMCSDEFGEIFPGIVSLAKNPVYPNGLFGTQDATGHALSIPMPGQPISLANAQADVEKLEKLIDEHDTVFLLMDSRECRWLPTITAASRGKVI
jgi:hypothetical protein